MITIEEQGSQSGTIVIHCAACSHSNLFRQPYRYHAGFGTQGFLYDDKGARTLLWHGCDPDFSRLFGNKLPYSLTPEEQHFFEDALLPAAGGGRWRFSNPPRCQACREPIGQPMMKDIMYQVNPGSVIADEPPENGLRRVLRAAG